MKVTAKASDLLAGLKIAGRIVERRNTIPILANVALIGEGGGLWLRSTDLDIMATTAVLGSETSHPGKTTAPAHMLRDFVAKLPADGQVALETDDKSLKVKCGRARMSLHTLPIEDFPDLEMGDGTNHNFSIEAAELLSVMQRASFAISTEETRYYLNGVYVHATKDALFAVATDGHRLAKIQFGLPEGAEGIPGVVIPRKTVGALIQLAAGIKNVGIFLHAGKIQFELGDTVMTSKLIDGTFPDYARVIPTSATKIATIDRREAADAIARVSTVGSDRGRAVKFAFDGKAGLELSVRGADAGSAKEDLDVEFDGEPIDIGFNSRYLLDVLAQIEGETFKMKMSDPGSPTIFRANNDDSATYVCMPLRV
jgi:DNA polymerase III subunit beta